jgi:predicted dehydrogenase
MAIDLTPEQRATGKANFANTADGLTRRGFMKSLAVAGGALAVAVPATYFGYQSIQGKPVKAALIGGGDEGGILVADHNPQYLEFVAVCDIRPWNMRRIFEGEPLPSPRKGLKKVYGLNADKNIKKLDTYEGLMEELRKNKDIEAIVIALPLCMHAKAAIDAMKIGQERGKPIHVLTEKLMAWNIAQCKQMIRTAKETGSILSVGHQRHYSMLYAHAIEVVNAGVLGDIRHIRALWHRNFTWPFDSKTALDMVSSVEATPPFYRDGWFPPIRREDYDALAGKKDMLNKYGFDNIEQLVHWRLYQATGGGLMAELGSHQLDACSIFLGHVHPLAVSGVGVRSFFGPGRNDRDIDDHVFATYEFPGKTHAKDKQDVVVVTYSSISTNGFEKYGECVTGDRGTLIVEEEKTVMLYPENEPGKVKTQPRGTEVGVSATGKDKPVLESGSTWGGSSGAVTGTSVGPANISRGYREEMEDFAYCVRRWDPKLGYQKNSDGKYKQRLTRCHGEVAMVDAIIALTANYAMHKHQRVEFQDAWFDADKPDVPPSDQKAKVEIA